MTVHSEMYGDDQLLEELFNAPSFIQLTAQHELVDDTQWQLWFEQYPRFQEVKLVARKLYELKYFESIMTVNEGYSTEIWEGIVAHLDNNEQKAIRHRFGRLKVRLWLPYAAILIATCIFGFWIYLQQATTISDKHYSTSTSKQSFTLPDGSKLWLNKHSIASYQEDGSGRTLKLKGEGYLEVTKQIHSGQKVPFTVQSDRLKVEVLGTRFNVVNTSTVKLIGLDEGSVRAHYDKQYLIMKPGEVVNVDHGVLKKLPIRSDLINSWQTGILNLNKTSLNEMIIWLQFTYRKKVVGSLPSEVMDLTVSGQIDISERDNVLKSLGNLYHINISEEKEHFEITTLK